MMKSYWRSIAAPIIKEVIDRVGLDDEKTLRTALREAYPFYERDHHPYKIWLDEIAVQTGKKKPAHLRDNVKKDVIVNPNQEKLF